MDTRLIVSASPHLRSEESTTSLMANVIVALTPCVVASAIIFGWRALLVTAVSVIACVGFEWLYCKLLKKPNPIGDLSAVVTGIILAMNVPVGMPLGQLIVGDLVAIVVVKQLFGGIGMNFANPALVGRIVLFVSFASSMNTFVYPDAAVDQLSSATPLKVADTSKLSLLDLFMGIHGGVLGETCALACVPRLAAADVLPAGAVHPAAPPVCVPEPVLEPVGAGQRFGRHVHAGGGEHAEHARYQVHGRHGVDHPDSAGVPVHAAVLC